MLKKVFRRFPLVFNIIYWRRIAGDIGVVLRLMRDGRVPFRLKLIPILVGLYLLSPLDLIPGFIPILGQLDDLGVLLLGMTTFIRLAPDEVVAEYRPEEA